MALIICRRCRQYSGGTRARWISPQRMTTGFPSSMKASRPITKRGLVSVAGDAAAPEKSARKTTTTFKKTDVVIFMRPVPASPVLVVSRALP